MRKSFAFAALLVAACSSSGPDSGTYKVTWSVTDSAAPAGAATCDSYKIADVIFSASDTTTGDTHMISHPCSDGAAELSGVPLGTHRVKLEAMGTAGDLAGRAEMASMLAKDGDDITLAPVAIEVLPPTAAVHTIWQITKAGVASTCAAVGSTGVSVTLTPEGGVPTTDIWDCTEPNAKTPLAYGAFAHSADLLGAGDAVIASAADQDLTGARGTITVPVTFAVP